MGFLALLWRRNHRSQRLALLCAVGLALASPRALAAAAMCDPIGMSVIAPIPVLPNATGNLVAPKNCDDTTHEWVGVDHGGHRSPAVLKTNDVPERVVVVPLGLAPPRGVALPRPDAARIPNHPGFTVPVYRPPRP